MASNRLGNSTGIGITGFGAPADADGESLIDTLRVFETPEGVDLALRLAGPAHAPRRWRWIGEFVWCCICC